MYTSLSKCFSWGYALLAIYTHFKINLLFEWRNWVCTQEFLYGTAYVINLFAYL